MARARANPDPHVEQHSSPKWGRIYEIRARRDGSYAVYLEGRLIRQQAEVTFGIGLAVNRYPSNRLQEQALRAARLFIESTMLSAEG